MVGASGVEPELREFQSRALSTSARLPLMVGMIGFEPMTFSLSERRSNHLNYTPIFLVDPFGYAPNLIACKAIVLTIITMGPHIFLQLVGIEPTHNDWKSLILPLNYNCNSYFNWYLHRILPPDLQRERLAN